MTSNPHIQNIDRQSPFRGLRDSLGVCIIFVLALVSAALWRWWCVPYGDDYIYSHMFETDGLTRQSNNWLGHPITTLGDAWTSTCRHYMTGPGRLANSLSFFMALLPHWFVVGLGALAVASQPLLAALVAGGRQSLRRPTALVSLYILMWVLLPWYDHMQSIVFLTNYVFSACAILLAMLVYRNLSTKIPGLFVGCLLAIIASWMHEGFSVALIAWMVGYLMLHYRRSQLLMLLCALLGFVLSLSPGTWGRIGESTGFGIHIPVQDILLLTPIVILAVASICLCSQRIKEGKLPACGIKELLPYWLGIAANLAVVIASHASGRALWPAILLSLTALWQLIYLHRPIRWRWLWIPLSAVYVLLMYVLIITQIRVSDVHHRVHPLLTSSNIVYCDSVITTAPWYALGVPLTDKYTDRINLHFENQAAHSSGMPVILPSSCRGLQWSQWPEVPGDNPYRGSLSHMVTTDSVIDPLVRLHMGEPLPAMSPIKRLVTSTYRKIAPDAQLTVRPTLDRVCILNGDTLYRVSLPPLPYLWSDRPVIAVDLIR